MKKLRTPDNIGGVVEYQQYILSLPTNIDIQRFFWGGVVGVSFLTSWEEAGTMTPFEAANHIKEALDSIMPFNLLGTIQAVFRDTLDPAMLLCDGAVYDKVDYPELWEIIPSWSKDATTLTVPDLSGQFIRGLGGAEIIGDTGGESEHVLDIVEMPTHSHTNSPHNHSEITASPFPTLVGAGAPAVYAVSGVGATGLAGVTIDDSGGGEAHNNLPPYYVLAYAIVAKVRP